MYNGVVYFKPRHFEHTSINPTVQKTQKFILPNQLYEVAERYLSGDFIIKRNSCTAAFDSGRRFSIPL
jgi:hypothetical protein